MVAGMVVWAEKVMDLAPKPCGKLQRLETAAEMVF